MTENVKRADDAVFLKAKEAAEESVKKMRELNDKVLSHSTANEYDYYLLEFELVQRFLRMQGCR